MKIINKIKKTLKINKKLFIFLFVFSLIGIISGSFLSVTINSDEKKIVCDYLNTFFVNLSSSSKKEFLNILISTLGLTTIIYILGISVIGFIIILFILFGKSFIIGFSIGSFINIYKLKGIIYMFVYIFPHQIINFFLFIIISGMALVISFKIISSLTKEKKIDFKGINKYTKSFIIILIIQFILALYETFLMPKVFSFII